MLDVSTLDLLSTSDADIILDIENKKFQWEWKKYGLKDYANLRCAINKLVNLNILFPVDTVYATEKGRNDIPFANKYRVNREFWEMIDYYS
ncbi:hypothetical protein [Enterococcus sp.]|uniref:hypothetical protein n=1 Tax=Enterococcus sp. TaxID=35783 RepID=UPI00289C1273|nr:hypothetical protein [Enterococcus sp.]